MRLMGTSRKLDLDAFSLLEAMLRLGKHIAGCSGTSEWFGWRLRDVTLPVQNTHTHNEQTRSTVSPPRLPSRYVESLSLAESLSLTES